MCLHVLVLQQLSTKISSLALCTCVYQLLKLPGKICNRNVGKLDKNVVSLNRLIDTYKTN